MFAMQLFILMNQTSHYRSWLVVSDLAVTTGKAGKSAPRLTVTGRLSPAFLASSTSQCSFWTTSTLPSRYRLPKRVLVLPQGERCARSLCRLSAEARFNDEPL